MSLDLWNEFVDDTGEPLGNPWAQAASSNEKFNGTNRMQTRPFGVRPPSQTIDGWSNSYCGQTEWHGSAIVNKVPPPGDTEPNSSPGTENLWATSHSHTEELSPWPVSEGLSRMTRISPISSPCHGITQDDDFGDFETPNLPEPFYETVQQELPLTTYKEVRLDQMEKPQARAISPLYSTTLSHQEDDPYSDIEKLNKSLRHQHLRSESANEDLCSSESPQVKKMDKSFTGFPPVGSRASLPIGKSLDVSYGVGERGEFSPDSPTSSDLTKRVLPVKSGKGQSSIRTSHSPSQSVPRAKEIEDSMQLAASKDREVSSTPPSNVPPPSILIGHMSTLVPKLPSQIEAVMLRSSEGQFSQEALDKALRGYIASLRVSARILAGRKVRWKRDSHLSQSMKIGPAQAGKKGGMKLTGVDKGELQREDREGAEFVRTWKQHLGSIRAALATVNRQISGSPLVLPEISERMVIHVAKASEGSVNSSKTCALCGLKREERIAKVDIDIWDGFEEWWSDFWGHTECRTFWEEHERFLQQR